MSNAPRPTLAAARSIILETMKQTSTALGKDVTRARGALNQTLWQAQQALGLVPNFFSGAGQDMLLDTHIFANKHGGVFVDIGCGDGATHSNTLFLEVFRGWSGLLIDAREAAVSAATSFRRAQVLQAAIGDEGQEASFIEATSTFGHACGLEDTIDEDWLATIRKQKDYSEVCFNVTTRSLANVLAENQIGAVDFLSVNLAGAELAVLGAFDFAAHPVRVWSVENTSGQDELSKLMEANGYALVDYFGTSEVFVDPATQAALVEKMNEG